MDEGSRNNGTTTNSGIVVDTGPEQNVWRKVRADRASVLVDADAYFRAVHHALLSARQQVLILGWDIDSRLCLRRDLLDANKRRAATLGPLLQSIVSRTAGPDAYVLAWDFAVIYAFEREAFPQIKLGWSTHRRLHFELDNMHPLGASQHQKLVIVDDKVAFCGGLDLCGARWDTPAHLHDDPRRHDPPLKPHAPFHDVQMMVAGDAAAALGAIARERWFKCTGERIAPPVPDRPARFSLPRLRRRSAAAVTAPAASHAAQVQPSWMRAWSPDVTPEFENVDVAIARTEPPFNGRPLVREVEKLHVDSVRKAKKHIYIENQYFTSHVVAAAMAERLAEQDAPELVVVQPRECSGWLEASTMGVLRRRLMEGLRKADHGDRVRLFYPHIAPPPPDDEGACEEKRVNVHSKVTIVDDTFLRVGSANLSNRSMGFDSECDLIIEAKPDDLVTQRAIAAVRERLLGEHLGVAPAAVREACAAKGFVAGVESLREQNPEKTLRVLDVDKPTWLEPIVTASSVIDPERPIRMDPLIDRVLPPEAKQRRTLRAALTVTAVLGVLLAIALAWRVTPLSQFLSPENIQRVAAPFVDSPLGPLYGVGVFIVGGLLIVPLSLLTVQSGVLFGPLIGCLVAFTGALGSATVSYWIGRALGTDLMARLIGRDRLRMTSSLRTRGVLAVAALRLLPVAPYTVVNLAAGAVRVPFLTFLAGTFLGIAPGTVVLTLFASGIVAAVRHPTPGFIAAIAAGLIALFAVSASLIKFVKRRQLGAPPVSSVSSVPQGPSGTVPVGNANELADAT
jgi:phospholipase D1/2